ncbi:MAG: TetR/AcrR family transcriptional regulator [Oceanicaulis sp.]
MNGEKPALQARSKKTRDSIVAALDRLLKQRPFEQVSVAEIAREAGVSVGAVYTRFENKDALIPVLFELYQKRLEEETERQAAAPAPEGLRATLKSAMGRAWTMMERHGHLMRAAHLHARLRPDLVGPEWEPLIENSRRSIRALIDHHSDEIRHPDPALAAETLTYFLNTALIEAGLYPDIGPPLPARLSGGALAEELADFAWGYLTAPR